MNPIKSPEASASPTRKNVIYSEVFRRDSVAAWRASGLSVPKYAKEIGVHETSLYGWIRSEESPLSGVAGGGAKTPASVESLQVELRLVRAELERIRQQRDILKKTLGIVCEPPLSATPGSPR